MPTMQSGLGGPAGYGENAYSGATRVAGNVDDGSVRIDVTSVFGQEGINFFGTSYSSLYLNSNGLITFDSPQTSYTPSGISGITEPAIAPFWTDVDVSKGGEIYWDVDPDSDQITFTWLNVAPYRGAATSGTNSFQVVLTSNGNGDFSVEFIYQDIQWTNGYTGHATVGVTDGGSNDFELEGSGTGAFLTNYENNDFDVGQENGVWSFSVRDGQPDYRDYVVEGTDAAETIDASYVDEDGDRVDNGDHFDNSNDDEIAAGGGDDLVFAGSGNDTVRGDAGDDTLQGQGGDDELSGGTGSDSLSGGEGNDLLSGDSGDDTLQGGMGNDTLTGGSGADVFVFDQAGGADLITDFDRTLVEGRTVDQLNVSDLRTLSGDTIRWRDVTVSDDGSGNAVLTFPEGESVVLQGVTPDEASGKQNLARMGVPCYAPGTLIDTPDGPRAVETLRVGDLVTTLDHGPQPIRWVHSDDQPLDTFGPEARPVLIAANALGKGLPGQDLIVSPQHHLFVGGRGQLDAWFQGEAFVPAKALTTVPGIRHMKGRKTITWIHFACDRHEVITANGCLSESLLVGPVVVNGLTSSDRRALMAVFGAAPSQGTPLNGPAARKCLRVSDVRRHLSMCRQTRPSRAAKEIKRQGATLVV